MINLIDVANTLSKYLNGDPTLVNNELASERPNYNFMVYATGFHLDSIINPKTRENVIFVAIDSLGGSINPIINVQETTVTVPVTMFFPIQYKNDFMGIGDFLADVFVGKIIDYGGTSGEGLCNISLIQYGELQDIDLNQFKSWVKSCYNMEISANSTFMSLSFNLYISTAKNLHKANGFLYGNDVNIDMYLFNNQGDYVGQTAPYFVESGYSQNNDVNSQQIIGSNFITNEVSTTADTIAFTLYVQNNQFWLDVLTYYFEGTLNDYFLEIKQQLFMPIEGSDFDYEITQRVKMIITSSSLNVSKGNLLTMSFNLARKE